MSRTQIVESMVKHYRVTAWLRWQAWLPIGFLLVGLFTETMVRAFLHHLIHPMGVILPVGDIVRGGGAALFCLMVIGCREKVLSYRDAFPAGPTRENLDELAERMGAVMVAAALPYALAVGVAEGAYALELDGQVTLATWIVIVCTLSNCLALSAGVLYCLACLYGCRSHLLASVRK